MKRANENGISMKRLYQKGQTLVEMGMISALVAVVCIGTLGVLGASLGDMIGGMNDDMSGGSGFFAGSGDTGNNDGIDCDMNPFDPACM